MNRTAAGSMLGWALLGLGCKAGPPPGGDRLPAVAGKFYPEDPKRLEAAVRAFLQDAVPARGERPLAILAPHAGYVFSGQIAADAWRQAQGHEVDTVVILGTNHTVPPFAGLAIGEAPGCRTPLGRLAVDRELAGLLAKASPRVRSRPDADAREHSIEVQLPFVQVLFPKARILPCLVGTADAAIANELGKALASVLKGRRALVVASSDLSHYPDAQGAAKADRIVLEAAAGLDLGQLRAGIRQVQQMGLPGLDTAACGEGAVLVAMAAAREMGATRGAVLSYAHSGQTVFGDPGRVVGYGAMMWTQGPGASDTAALLPPPPASGSLAPVDRVELLRLARTTLERHFSTGMLPLPRLRNGALAQARGAFVTLTRDGQLRGCIGHMAEDAPLALNVCRMALQAALQDRRFPPVQAGEVAGLHLEISALTPLEPAKGPEGILVGRDGVVLEKAGRRAVFLPQVASEQGWTRDQMLDQLCLKAGLASGAWRSGTSFWTFRAEVFGEPEAR